MKLNIFNLELLKKLATQDKLILIAKIVITICMITYIAINVSFKETLSIISNANLSYLLIVVALTFLNLFIQFQKWKFISKVCLSYENDTTVATSLFQGFAAGIFTPGRIGEYVGRSLAFKEKTLLEVITATVIDKMFNLLIITFFGSLSAILFISYFAHVSSFVTVSLFILLFCIYYILFLLLSSPKIWEGFILNSLRKVKYLKDFIDKLILLKRLDRTNLTKIFLLSFVFYLTFVTQFALLMAAYSNSVVNLLDFTWIGSIVFFTNSVIPSVTLGELGIRESAALYFSQRFGYLGSIGFNAALSIFFFNILVPAIIGLFLLTKKNK